MRHLLWTVLLSVTLGAAASLPASACDGDWSEHSERSRYRTEEQMAPQSRMRKRRLTKANSSRHGARQGGQRKSAHQGRRQVAAVNPEPSAPALPKKSLSNERPRASGQVGVASYYWQGQRVASGGRFNPDGMTAAHRTLPFGTRVRVTHMSNGRSVDVTINDRGPFIAGRIIDLSRGAAGVIGLTSSGIARVSVDVLGR